MLFSSSSLSAISVVSSTYLRLLIFLPAILVPVFAFFRGEHNPILIILHSILEESKAILSIRSKATSVQSHDTADYVQSKGEKERYTHLNAEFQKKSISDLLTMPKPLTVWITTNCGKFLKRWEHPTTWPASWEICMQVKKQQLGPDMEQ